MAKYDFVFQMPRKKNNPRVLQVIPKKCIGVKSTPKLVVARTVEPNNFFETTCSSFV
jgi:hypothetical protein